MGITLFKTKLIRLFKNYRSKYDLPAVKAAREKFQAKQRNHKKKEDILEQVVLTPKKRARVEPAQAATATLPSTPAEEIEDLKKDMVAELDKSTHCQGCAEDTRLA